MIIKKIILGRPEESFFFMRIKSSTRQFGGKLSSTTETGISTVTQKRGKWIKLLGRFVYPMLETQSVIRKHPGSRLVEIGNGLGQQIAKDLEELQKFLPAD